MTTQADIEKTRALLTFLDRFSRLRRKRKTTYGPDEKILWLAELADFQEDKHVRSPFFLHGPRDVSDLWLEITRPASSEPPAVPPPLRSLIRPEDLQNPRREPELERGGDHGSARNREPDSKELLVIWQQYLEQEWRPWAATALRVQKLQEAYETLDFMRRRIEEAEEIYELVLGLGLMIWIDPLRETIRRHFLTARGEISLDARNATLRVTPAANMERFNIELDMLELQHQPRLDRERLDRELDDVSDEPWKVELWREVAKEVAHRIDSVAEIITDPWLESAKPQDRLRVYYAPALILRRRHLVAYDELVKKFSEQIEIPASITLTQPWQRLIREGREPVPVATPQDPAPQEDARLYFPLPTNEEQRQIARRLRERPYVLVKGPPGTGKSHTIANLICHLLARGERVLITAHALKALEVLLELLPQDIACLCVTALGSTREDNRRLEGSVRAILGRRDSFSGPRASESAVSQKEKELQDLETEIAVLDREIRQLREAETHIHSLPGSYQGTAAQIARALEGDRDAYGWFPDVQSEQSRCPLAPAEIEFLAEMHSALNDLKRGELNQEVYSDLLPSVEQWMATLDELAAAEQEWREACSEVDDAELRPLRKVSNEWLELTDQFLSTLDQHDLMARQRLGALADSLFTDLLAGKRQEWQTFTSELTGLLAQMNKAMQRGADARVHLLGDSPIHQLKADVQRRYEHFAGGGGRGFGPFAPRLVRETRYVETSCRVNGSPPRRAEELQQLLAFLEFKEALGEFERLCWGEAKREQTNHRTRLEQLTHVVDLLRGILKLFEQDADAVLKIFNPHERQALRERDHRAKWRRLLRAEVSRRRLEDVQSRIKGWESSVERILARPNVHPCMRDVWDALRGRSAKGYEVAWHELARLRQEKQRLRSYEELLSRLQPEHPQLAQQLRDTEGDPAWRDRLMDLERAWAWAAARKWLQKFSDPERYDELALRRQRTQQEMERKLLELVTEKAWRHFFARLDPATEQHLVAWTKAMARIGAGTGKHAFRHRRQARQHLVECLRCIPAWIMPLHKVWETAEPTPGLFDTVIVDEASQAGVDSLLLLLLAKRIVVVGDDQQNSPEAVGIAEEDIHRLIKDHLGGFVFGAEYRPDASLYDHAERAFGQPISLREHFRCVPEIIRFSNELCYEQTPLIALRQPPPERLEPVRTRFIEGGFCEGDGQNLVNPAEAEQIAAQIRECLGNDQYADKSIGVIVLQGRAQAELIEQRLVQMLTPKQRQDHRIRCGVPATFQGDQRDVIFLSLVVAPNHRFRALTELEARRRFNVAMSRARDQVWLFHSVSPDDLNSNDLRYRLLQFCLNSKYPICAQVYEERERLERESRLRPRSSGTQPDPFESWFEVDVALELLRRGYRLLPQYEFAGYRIDLVLEGHGNRLAVECDGDYWHGEERFHHDMYRQRQLERAGWNFVRLRASEFYANRDRAIHRIIQACEELEILPAAALYSPSEPFPTRHPSSKTRAV